LLMHGLTTPKFNNISRVVFVSRQVRYTFL